jgi:capsular exopolysaccharide synthesis family protein
LIKELFNNKIFDKKDVEKYSPYPYLGAIKHTSTKDPVPVQRSPRSGLAESYRVIRTRIEFVVQRQYPTSVLVTSTESGDGKTAFSMNVAAMYALTGRKTVVVDLDLRKPSIANRLGLNVDTKKGVSNYLIGQVESLDDLIIKNTKYKFDIVPGGSVPPNPGELIRSDKLKELYHELCSMYDHVIIDTSPIGLVADAYALMYMVDANLFLVRSEKTNKIFFKSILQQMRSDKMERVYVVLNDVDEKKNSYSYYHEYGRRSYYMKKDEYHTYAKEYFDEDESFNKTGMIKRDWLGFRKDK